MARLKEIKAPTDNEKKFLQDIQGFSPGAAVLSSCFVQPTSHRSKYPALPSMPPTLMSLGRVHYKDISKTELKNVCKDVFEELAISPEEFTLLFWSTVLQSNSLLDMNIEKVHQSLVQSAILLYSHHQSRLFFNELIPLKQQQCDGALKIIC